MTAALVALAVLVLLGVAALVVGRVRRLHLLHIRTDAARAGLDAALRHRAATALRVAGSGPLRAAALRALATPGVGTGREVVENALSARLADVAPTAELHEAEQLLVLGRRVHNDAVRDTLALRSRPLVRWLRLAGRAPLPAYFEIADPTGVTRVATDSGTPPQPLT